MENVNVSRINLQNEATELKREIGLFSASNILMGIMVGSGIFYLGSYVLIRSGMSMGLALLVWIIGGIVTLLSGLCYAELGAMMPKAGGAYVYLREAYGEGVSFISGLSGFILGSCGSTASLAIAFPTAIGNLIPLTPEQIKIIAVAAVSLLTIVNIMGVKQGSIVQNIFTVGKLIPIGLIIVAGIFLGNETPNLSLVPQTNDVSATSLIGMVGFSVVATLWAYEGWTNLNVVSEEIKNPSKNIPRAITMSIIFVTILYVLFNFALYRVLPSETVSTLIAEENYFLGTEAASVLFGNTGFLLVGVCMSLAVFGALNGCVMVFPRSCYAIARDGMLPKSFAKVHPKYKTPYVSIIVHLIISVGLIFARDLDQLTSLVVFNGMIFNTLTFYSVLCLRKKYPNLHRPYRVPTPIVYITVLITIALAVNTLFEDVQTSIIGLSVTALSYIIYLVIKRRNASKGR